MPSLSDLANTAEASLTTFQNDQASNVVKAQKITALQTQLTADQGTTTTDGTQAYTDVQNLIDALQAVQKTLPQPAPPPVPAPVPVPVS